MEFMLDRQVAGAERVGWNTRLLVSLQRKYVRDSTVSRRPTSKAGRTGELGLRCLDRAMVGLASWKQVLPRAHAATGQTVNRSEQSCT